MKTSQQYKLLPKYKFQLFFTRTALEQAKHFVRLAQYSECQWFHFLHRHIDEESKVVSYVVDGMVIPEQSVTGTYVETDAKLMVKLAMELRKAEGITSGPDGSTPEQIAAFNKKCQTLTVWCHSHVKMATNPSSTDRETWEEWNEWNSSDDRDDPIAMFIFNQKDEYFMQLYDPKFNYHFVGLPIEVWDRDVDFTYVDDALKNKLKKRSSTSYRSTGTPSTGYRSGNPKSQTHATGQMTTTRTNGGGHTKSKITPISAGHKGSDKFQINWTITHAAAIMEAAGKLTDIDKLLNGDKPIANSEALNRKRVQLIAQLSNIMSSEYFDLRGDLGLFEGILEAGAWIDINQCYQSYVGDDEGRGDECEERTVFDSLTAFEYNDIHPELFIAALECTVAYQLFARMPELNDVYTKQFQTLWQIHNPDHPKPTEAPA